MKNQKEVLHFLKKEYRLARNGDNYIFNACDGINFIGHLLFLATNGKEGKKREGNYWDKPKE